MRSIENYAVDFSKSIKLYGKKITEKNLIQAISKKGFIVKKYSESAMLLITLGLYDESKRADSVSAIDSNSTVYIFINDTIPDKLRLFTLAHEIGHIVLKHHKDTEHSRWQENEADLFAHTFLSQSSHRELNVPLAIVFLLCAVTIISNVVVTESDKEQIKVASADKNGLTSSNDPEISSKTVCYFTPNGNVYHLYRDCYYIKNSNKIFCDTYDHTHKDKLCSACKRRFNSE